MHVRLTSTMSSDPDAAADRGAGLLDDPPGQQDYIEPADLLHGIVSDTLPLDPEVLQSFEHKGADCTELRFLSEIHAGERIHMHAWLCRPRETAGPLPPVLLIPGGQGRIHRHDEPAWIAATARAVVLAVDWIGAGLSDSIAGLSPWANAMRFEGDYTQSFQYHNLRALMRATELLRSQPGVETERLMAIGGSWGGFYSWLLAGLDERFTHIFPTYGCGFLDTEARCVWESYFASMGAEQTEQWLRAFDPGRRAHLIRAKVFYQHATNDRFYSLVAAMETYRRVVTDKRLLLVRNQDHLTKPFNAQDVALLRSAIAGHEWDGMPQIHAARWIEGTNLVEVEATDAAALELSVVFSGGSYTKSFARYWRQARVELRDGRYVAEIPVVDPARELWFYGHAVATGPPPRGASTQVTRIVPAQAGLTEPTAEFEPALDFGSADLFDLPVGDRHFPEMRLVQENGTTALAMRFGQDPSRRGVAYCLEGDLLAGRGYDGIEVRVRVPDPADVPGLKLCLVTDFNALAEQDYAVDLEQMGLDLSEWQLLRLPFTAFEPIMSRRYDFYQPPLRPLEVSRLCGVGIYHGSLDYRGEALLADISLVRFGSEATAQPEPVTQPDPVTQPEPVTQPDPMTQPDPVTHPEPVGQPDPVGQPEPAAHDPYGLHIDTALPAAQLRERLLRWAPWRYEVSFSNGVRTSDLPTAEPFVAHPVSKWHIFEKHLPVAALRGGRALDVGSNIGHYAFFLRKELDMDVVGLELNPRNLEVARFLLGMTGLDRVRFLAEDANWFRAQRQCDLVLHFGTLDHFKNPFQALENAAATLVPGGYLALEVQTYKDPSGDETICKFQPHTPTSQHTVWWLLGKQALLNMLEIAGFSEVEILLEWDAPERIGPTMRRLNLVARTPD